MIYITIVLTEIIGRPNRPAHIYKSSARAT